MRGGKKATHNLLLVGFCLGGVLFLVLHVLEQLVVFTNFFLSILVHDNCCILSKQLSCPGSLESSFVQALVSPSLVQSRT